MAMNLQQFSYHSLSAAEISKHTSAWPAMDSLNKENNFRVDMVQAELGNICLLSCKLSGVFTTFLWAEGGAFNGLGKFGGFEFGEDSVGTGIMPMSTPWL